MCEHKEFKTQANIFRLSNIERGPITNYLAEIEITCAECHMPFKFKGLEGGLNKDYPTTDVERIQARMPIEPV